MRSKRNLTQLAEPWWDYCRHPITGLITNRHLERKFIERREKGECKQPRP